jgi:hypothetical protein
MAAGHYVSMRLDSRQNQKSSGQIASTASNWLVNRGASRIYRIEADLNEVPSAFGSGHGFLRGMLSSAGWIRPSPMRIWATKRSLQSADSKKKSIQTP